MQSNEEYIWNSIGIVNKIVLNKQKYDVAVNLKENFTNKSQNFWNVW